MPHQRFQCFEFFFFFRWVENNLGKEESATSLFITQSRLKRPLKRRLENTVRKGENADNQHFLLFSHFLLFPLEILIFESELICCLQN